MSIVHACRHAHKDTYANPAHTLPAKEWPHPPPPPSLLPALWSSWAESEVTWDGEGPPLLTHSHTAFYCDGTLNPITSIWQDCYSDIKGNLTGTWWMPLQSINSWLQWKLQRGRPLPSVHGVCGHAKLHLTVLSFSLWDSHALKPPGLQTWWDGWTAGAPAAATPVCTAGSPARELWHHLAKIPQTIADYHKVTNAMTASLLGRGRDSMMDLRHYLIILLESTVQSGTFSTLHLTKWVISSWIL